MRLLPALLLFLGIGAPAQDPVRVGATLSAPRITVGETVTLGLWVETRGAAPEVIATPTFPAALEVVATSDVTQRQFVIPGGSSRITRREITLLARAPGEFRIPAVTVRVEGTAYRTTPLVLTVVSASAAPPPTSSAGTAGASGGAAVLQGGTLARGPDDDVLLYVRLAPDTVYVGQQVMLSAEALISEEANLRLRRAPEYVPPSAAGFWVHDLPGPVRAASRPIGGRSYQGQLFQRAFFPLTPGRYTLPPARLSYETRRAILAPSEEQEIVTDSLTIVARPLPEAGRPANFTGAVGRFQLRARLEPAEVPVGEGVSLVVEVEGEGNIKALPPPALTLPHAVELYPPSEDTQLDVADGRVRGTKRFSWILIPREAGRLEIPAVEYPYFDPARGQYDVARADPLVLRVRTGAEPATKHGEETIRPLKPAPAVWPALQWVHTPTFAALQLAPLLALLTLMLRRRRARSSQSPSPRALRRARADALAAVGARLEEPGTAFFEALAALIREEVAERAGDPALRRATPAALAESLQALGVSSPAARALERLLGKLLGARYAPEPPGSAERRQMHEEAERLLTVVDREARRPAPPSTTAVLGLLLLALAVAPHPVRAQGGEFARGRALYERGDYPAAARAFEAHVQSEPRDPHGWYNLGNSYQQAGERGRAIHAWLNAYRLSPRDPDTRHNLGVAHADPALLRRAAPLPLSAEERWLVASLGWLLGAAAALTALRRRRAVALGVGAAALALPLALLFAASGSPVGVVLEDRAPLRIAPTLRADTVRTLEGGSRVRLVEERGAWLRVRAGEGGEGWVEGRAVGWF
jgi:tetratricopeptide (TPR) repeat protein